MTVAEAQAILNGRLIFGDSQQIEARKVLEAYGQLWEARKSAGLTEECPRCRYYGCAQCQGIGLIDLSQESGDDLLIMDDPASMTIDVIGLKLRRIQRMARGAA